MESRFSAAMEQRGQLKQDRTLHSVPSAYSPTLMPLHWSHGGTRFLRSGLPATWSVWERAALTGTAGAHSDPPTAPMPDTVSAAVLLPLCPFLTLFLLPWVEAEKTLHWVSRMTLAGGQQLLLTSAYSVTASTWLLRLGCLPRPCQNILPFPYG